MSFEQDNQNSPYAKQTDNAAGGSMNGESGGASDPSVGFNDGSADGENGEFIATEEKKPAMSQTTLIMFGVLALSAAGVWLMYQRVGPGKAAAAPNPESVQAKKTINAFLDGGGSNIRSMETMLRSTERVVQQFLTYPSMTQVPLSDLRTNPFRLRAPRPANAALDDAAERRKREEERVAMLKSVQSLRLQSIMYSETRKACMINDAMFREGQTVDAFTIEKVTANSVIVKGGVYRFELRMQR
ncbi:hypothetical protein BH09PLA1_BH09PLA1_26340 [soil metagenome]